MPFANSGNHKIFYEDTGGDLPVLVFSHGLLMDHEMFAPQVEAFRDHYRCISWDERGHGLTATEELAPFSYYDSADDLVQVLRHAGVDRAIFVGMSQGGYLSLRLSLRNIDFVRALILIDSQALPEDFKRVQMYKYMVSDWTANGLSDQIATGIADSILGPGWNGSEFWKEKWKGMLPVNVAGVFETICSRDDVSASMKLITVPVMVIHGESDKAIDIQSAQAMLADMPNRGEMVSIPGAAHAPNLTHPDIVNAAMRRFLEGLPN
jgi:pimeloyl-ACP methyl ester carboxylesterase